MPPAQTESERRSTKTLCTYVTWLRRGIRLVCFNAVHHLIIKCLASYQCQDHVTNNEIYILKIKRVGYFLFLASDGIETDLSMILDTWRWTPVHHFSSCRALHRCFKNKCLFFWKTESTRCFVLCLSLHIMSGDHVDLLPKQPNVFFFFHIKQYFFYKWMEQFPPVFFWLLNINNSLKEKKDFCIKIVKRKKDVKMKLPVNG